MDTAKYPEPDLRFPKKHRAGDYLSCTTIEKNKRYLTSRNLDSFESPAFENMRDPFQFFSCFFDKYNNKSSPAANMFILVIY